MSKRLIIILGAIVLIFLGVMIYFAWIYPQPEPASVDFMTAPDGTQVKAPASPPVSNPPAGIDPRSESKGPTYPPPSN